MELIYKDINKGKHSYKFYFCNKLNWADDYVNKEPIEIYFDDFNEFILPHIKSFFKRGIANSIYNEVQEFFDISGANFIGKEDFSEFLLQLKEGCPESSKQKFYDDFCNICEEKLLYSDLIVIEGNI